MNSFESQGVSFDIWKTLVKSNPDYKPARDTYIADSLLVPVDELKIVAREVDVAADKLTDTTGEQFGPIERLDRIARRQGIELSSDKLSSMAIDIQELFLEYPLMFNEPNLADTLAEIAKRKPITLTSNTGFIDGEYMRKALNTIGILESTKGRVFSNEVGVAKPDIRIFQSAASQLALNMHDIVHVGDNPLADYHGARRAGMQALLLRDDEGNTDGITAAPTIKDAVERGQL